MLRLRRTLAIALKESRQIRRDRRTLGLLLFVPALMLSLYGYALTFDVKHIAVAVLDHDQSPASRQFVQGLFRSEYFEEVGRLASEAEADEWLDAGRARAVLVVPPQFGERLEQGRPAQVQALVDGANASSASITVGYLEGHAREYSLARVAARLERLGLPLPETPLAVETRVWYNPALETSQFLVPGLVGFLLMVIGAVTTSLSVVREKERGTLEQVVVSAARPAEFLVGKALPYLLICLCAEALILLAAVFLFAVPVRGSLGWLFLVSVVYLLGALGFGLLISTVAQTQQVAFQVATMASMLPSMLLSDLIFPIESMPRLLQGLTYVVPARHFIAVIRGIVLKGAGPEAWATELAILAAFAAVMLAVASRRLAQLMRRG
ncbi:MAG: ABC transporter permease [Candidatus Latescibacterota bacterium]